MKRAVCIVCCLMFGLMASSEVDAKVARPEPVAPVVRDGFAYEVKEGQSGTVVKRDVATGRIEWTCQIYVISYETKAGLSKCVQGCPITQLALSERVLTVTNQRGYVYELNLDTLEITVKKGSRVIRTNLRTMDNP